jgi:hypothetical protein
MSLKEELWNMLFPEEPMIEPYDGAVDEYCGCLAEYLLDDFDYKTPELYYGN